MDSDNSHMLWQFKGKEWNEEDSTQPNKILLFPVFGPVDFIGNNLKIWGELDLELF